MRQTSNFNLDNQLRLDLLVEKVHVIPEAVDKFCNDRQICQYCSPYFPTVGESFKRHVRLVNTVLSV